MEGDIQSKLNTGKCNNIHSNSTSLKIDTDHLGYGKIKNKVQLMGILNATPDSFFDGGLYFTEDNAKKQGYKLIEEGADILDIGGESTRPNAEDVSIEEEKKRVLPLVKEFSKKITVSIDTQKPEVARASLEHGASFLNDVSGFSSPLMRKLANEFEAEVCVMHRQGSAKNMQKKPFYPKGIIAELRDFFKIRVDALLTAGVQPEKIILDPGIGFGKTVAQNLEILTHLSDFQSLGFPILIGLSRKSFMSKILNRPSSELLSTTLALNTMSLLEGVQIIRVHDVKEHKDVIDILKAFQRGAEA